MRPHSVVAIVVGVLAPLYGVAYFGLAFRTVYGGPTGRAVLRAAGVGAAYFIAVGLSVGVIVAAVPVGRT